MHQGIVSPYRSATAAHNCRTYRIFIAAVHALHIFFSLVQCILENLDLSVPARISVQTLGSNGLSSDGVHAVYRTSDRTGNL